MKSYERNWAASPTANADDESSAKQKDKSDYIQELAEHLDVDTNALQAALSDASEAVVKALVVELGPGGGEVSGNAQIPAEYSDGLIDGRSRDDVVDVATARDRVQTLVANSAGTGSSSDLEGKTFGEMSEDEIDQALDELGDKLVTEEDVAEILNGERSPSANAGDDGDVDLSEYPDGTITAGVSAGGSEPTGNASSGQRDTRSDDLDDYSDGTIGGGL